MFRKAQLKLFAMITGILLAIFIVVMSSINIVTKNFMKRQSEEILQTIASRTEYDEKSDTFSFTPPKEYDFKYNKKIPPPEYPRSTTRQTKNKSALKTTTATTTTTVTDEITTEAIKTTLPENTTAYSEKPPETQAESDTPTQPETPLAETRPESQPQETFPVITEPPPPNDYRHDWQKPTENNWNDNRHPDPPPERENEWHEPHDWQYFNNQDNIKNQSYNNNYIISGMANTIPEPPGDMPDDLIKNEPVPKSFGSVEFFIIMADKKGNYLACMNNDDLTEDDAQQYITQILGNGDTTGMLESNQFCISEKTNGTLIVLTDKSEEKKVIKQYIRTTIVIGSVTLIILSFIGYLFSKKSIEPIKTAFEKQKQFISDASHELKTPLTVISANADVLSGEIGENKWLNYIKSQTDRMNLLVNDLLNLTRLENNTSDFIMTEFSLSQAITNTALPFECRAFEDNKKFIFDIEDGLTVTGSEQHIKQMTAIFIDNALKYSNDNGIVKVTLKKQGDKKILSIYNTGQGVKDSEKEKIFERFYRTDDSRARQSVGGYGLGLAIAKSIIDKHKFRISIDNAEGKSICFIITM